ncbi:MAG TPA: acyl-CoA dehydrogenase family protein [Acidimicrobiales bacterium]|nr:acyl-CoA dehydrogenase family protein [Acidimicrobiales bacterium]
MRFSLAEDQVAFRDAVRDLFAKEMTPADVRAAATAPAGQLDRGVWRSLETMGVLGLLVAEADGGLGLDESFLVPILEEAGRVALPHPIVESAMVAAPLVGAVGMVSSDLGGANVACAADADRLLLHRGASLVLVERGEASLTPVDTVDAARRVARVGAGTSGRVVTSKSSVIERARERGALGTAAMLVGLGQTMLDMTVAYVIERRQFGVPVGSFQAVKHHLADARLALEFARPVVWRAAWSAAHDAPTRSRDASTAKAMASDAAELVARKALQCHGAIGYTVEADLHLFLKRTWALSRAWGDAAHHADRVAASFG